MSSRFNTFCGGGSGGFASRWFRHLRAIAYVVVLLPLGWFVGIFAPGPIFTAVFFLLVSIVINGAISLFIIYSNILDEDFGDFRVVLLPREPVARDAAAATPPAASPATP